MSRNPMLAVGVAAALALCATAAQAQTSTSPGTNTMSQPKAPSSMNGKAGMAKASKADQRFLKEAIEGDLSEVNMGKLAQQNGESQDVKQFGEMLQTDHGQHLQKVQAMAEQMGVTPPTAPSAKEKAIYERLSKEHGARFDKQFAAAMVKDHKQDIAKYEKEAKKKGELAQLAQQTLPTLQKHLKTAQAIDNKGAMTGSKAGAK